MCATCGCGGAAKPSVLDLRTGDRSAVEPAAHEHIHPDGTRHSHPPEHDHDQTHPHRHDHPHPHDHGHEHGTTVALEARILAKNDALAQQNRGWFRGREILALNLVSAPGAGKTALLERTIRDLRDEFALYVLEGDQATANDGERIRAAGAPAVQINTGTGCHLDALMVGRGLAQLKPPPSSVVLIENIGNLVCPALFDLGERAKVVIFSVTEGEDKPLKYPHMFGAADLVIFNKIDLLPHLDFDIAAAEANARAVNPAASLLRVSARSGEGLDTWYEWLRRERAAAGEASFA
jgi:hydrogenase nickel incorporation protein HypB